MMADEALMDCFARHELGVAVLYRGVVAFGLGRRINRPLPRHLH